MEKKKVLIIDDEIEFVDMISMRLKASGYEVVAAPDSESVLEKIRAERPDLIILDIMLPKVDGWKVCETVKKNPEFRKIPVILLTAKDPACEADRVQESGADECFIKPFEPRQLLDKIKELIKRSAQE